MSKKISTYSKKKMTLYDFVVYGFNYTASTGFVGSFYLLSKKGSDSIGMHSLWVFPIVGLIAGLVAWSFARLSQVHKSSNNGAAYIYVRSSFGRFAGAMILFVRYGLLPLLIVIQILFLIKGSFAPGYVGPNSPFSGAFLWAGNWADLFLDILGVAIYAASSLSLVLGMKHFKYVNKYASWVKWSTSFFLVLAAVYLAFKNSQLGYWTTPVAKGGGDHISFAGIFHAFTVFFFFYAGFEVFSTAGRNIENPNRTVKIGLMLIMLISTIFYIVIGFIFYAAFNAKEGAPNCFSQNMQIGAWKALGVKWIALAGAILMMSGQIGLKVQAAIQNALYGGTSLQPLAREGYISDYFKKLGRDNLPIRASLLNLSFVGLLVVVYLIIPDFLVGSKVFTDDQMSLALSVNGLVSTSSVLTIFVYAVVVLTFIKLSFERKIATSLWEWITMPFIFAILIFLFGYHYYGVINNVVSPSPGDSLNANIVALAIEMFFFSSIIVIGLVVYFFYYRPKYQERLKTNPEVQERLDKDFLVADDWIYVAQRIRRTLQLYEKRNFAIYGSYSNDHYLDAKALDKKLDKPISEFEVLNAERSAHDEDELSE